VRYSVQHGEVISGKRAGVKRRRELLLASATGEGEGDEGRKAERGVERTMKEVRRQMPDGCGK